jgi:hypothetical protein
MQRPIYAVSSLAVLATSCVVSPAPSPDVETDPGPVTAALRATAGSGAEDPEQGRPMPQALPVSPRIGRFDAPTSGFASPPGFSDSALSEQNTANATVTILKSHFSLEALREVEAARKQWQGGAR